MPDSKRTSTESLDGTIPGAFPDSSASSTGVSTQQSLSQAIYARRAEFTRPKTIRIKIGTWNVASFKGTEKDVGGWFVEGKGVTEGLGGLTLDDTTEDDQIKRDSTEGIVEQEARRTPKKSTIPHDDPGSVPGGEEIGLYVLGLQEVVDISSYSEALRPYTDPSTAKRWKASMEEALPPGYTLVAEQQLIGLLMLIYASPTVAPDVKSVSTTSVGTGVMGYMGNKGGVAARIVLGETTKLVFVDCHLAAGTDKGACDRRNWDAGQITTRTRFEPVVDSLGVTQGSGEKIGDEDFAFWFGDLNYRLGTMAGDDVRKLLELHTRNEYDVGRYKASLINQDAVVEALEHAKESADDGASQLSGTTAHESLRSYDEDRGVLTPTSDPTSLITTLSSLLPHDELHQQMKAKKAFHDGWREGPVKFMPTYKYDVGSVGVFDSSEKRRAPSWCDRILYRTRRDRLAYEQGLKDAEEARKKDEEMKARGMDQASDEEDVLFDYDPATDGAGDDDYDEFADPEPVLVTTSEGFVDEIQQEYYTSHQRVLSSDHKPLDAVFRFKYDAVDPDLKAKIHQEVARELDRAENEGRPTITLIVDRPNNAQEQIDDTNPEAGGINFGSVRYADTKRRSITIANTGQVPATVSFVDRPVPAGQSAGVTPSWLNIYTEDSADPSSGASLHILEPGDTLTIHLTLQVHGLDLVKRLNSHSEDLSDILVLRVTGGRDHFIPVRAQWQISSLGHSISKLIRIPEGGIRRLQGQGKGVTESGEVHFSAPKELFRLTEALEHAVERCVPEWDMINSSSSPTPNPSAPSTPSRKSTSSRKSVDVKEIKENKKPPWETNAGWPFAEDSWTCTDEDQRWHLKYLIFDALDTDVSLDNSVPPDTSVFTKTEVLAESFLLFLNSLEDGIVTSQLWKKLDGDVTAREKQKQKLSLEDERSAILETLSSDPSHNVSFVIVTSTLSRIVNELHTTNIPKDKTEVVVPSTPRGTIVRRRTLSKDPSVARRQIAEKSVAGVFAVPLCRFPEGLGPKDKARAEERAQALVETFLREL